MITKIINGSLKCATGLALAFTFATVVTGQSPNVQAVEDGTKTAGATQSIKSTKAAEKITPAADVVVAADSVPAKADPEKETPVAKTTPDSVPTVDVPAEEQPAAKTTKQAADEGWRFGLTPYLYMTGISGDVGALGRTAPIDQSIIDVLGHFGAGFMGTFDATKGKFVFFNDLFWARLDEETNTPGRLYNTGKVTVNMTMIQPAAGYRIVENEKGLIDILGGVRVSSVKNTLSFTTGILPGFTVESRKTWAAPTIGLHGISNITPKFFLSFLADVGGGFGTHITGQFYGGMGYRIRPRVSLLAGYRYLKNDYSNDSGFTYNTNMNGINLGMRFRF